MNGVWCGPEKMGPTLGWLVSASDSLGGPRRLLLSTVSVFLPSDRPVTRPRTVFGAPPARKAPVTLRPFKLINSELADWLLGKVISTRTSPPLTRSGQVQTGRIAKASRPCAVAAWVSRRWRERTTADERVLLRSRFIAILLVPFCETRSRRSDGLLDLLRRRPDAPAGGGVAPCSFALSRRG